MDNPRLQRLEEMLPENRSHLVILVLMNLVLIFTVIAVSQVSDQNDGPLPFKDREDIICHYTGRKSNPYNPVQSGGHSSHEFDRAPVNGICPTEPPTTAAPTTAAPTTAAPTTAAPTTAAPTTAAPTTAAPTTAAGTGGATEGFVILEALEPGTTTTTDGAQAAAAKAQQDPEEQITELPYTGSGDGQIPLAIALIGIGLAFLLYRDRQVAQRTR